MKKYIITEELLLNILKYMQTRPYMEVAKGIQELSNLEEIPQKEAKDAQAGCKEQSNAAKKGKESEGSK